MDTKLSEAKHLSADRQQTVSECLKFVDTEQRLLSTSSSIRNKLDEIRRVLEQESFENANLAEVFAGEAQKLEVLQVGEEIK